MLRLLTQLFRRPPIRMGRVDNSRLRTTSTRNAGFVSFMSGQGLGHVRYTDRHDNRLRRQKLTKLIGYLSLGSGCAWVAIESARALSIF